MPLWHLYVPEDAFTDEDMHDLANRITNIYSSPEAMENFGFSFPRFYTSVIFHEIKPARFCIGGEPRDKFIQIQVAHIAGGTDGDDRPVNDQVAETMGVTVQELFDRYFSLVLPALKPYIEDRGYEWEFSIQNDPAVSWRIDGMIPPAPGTEDMRRWDKENKASPRTYA